MTGWEWSDLVLAASILATALGVWWQMRRHRHIAALRATIDLIVHQEIHNPEWSRLVVTAEGVMANERRWDLLFDEDAGDPLAQEKLAAVLTVLNHYEVVAVAIAAGAIDEKLYKRWQTTGYNCGLAKRAEVRGRAASQAR